MVASRTVGDWMYWSFFYGIATIPAALFGGLMAGSYIYNYDHAHRSLWNQQEYADTLSYGEVAAAFICAVPGFAWVLWSQLRDWRKEQAKRHERTAAEVDEASIWPPAPHE